MKLWRRRAIYLTFILIFFILAPILIFYTAGYRLNLKKLQIKKTGVIVLETKPKGANIIIDQNNIGKTTPAQINNFFPNIYNIKLEKQGYHSWQKNLELKSNLTTFAKGIILFKDSLPILNYEGGIDNVLFLKKHNKLLFLSTMLDSSQIKIKDVEGDEEKLVYFLDEEKTIIWEDIELSKNQNKMILPIFQNGNLAYMIYNLDNSKIIDLSEATKINFELVHWDNLNENIIYGYNAGVLFQYNLIDKSIKRILAAEISDFYINNPQIIYITSDGLLNKKYLNVKTEVSSIKLPTNTNFSFDQGSSDFLTLIDKKGQRLLILKNDIFDNSKELINHIVLQTTAKDVVWTKESKNLIYYDDFELWVYNFNTNESYLLTRLGQGIDNAYWYTDNKYIIYESTNKIQVIELDHRDIRNDITLSQMEEIKGSFLHDDGEKIYIVGKIGKQQGIFELQIR